jgi:hypothetical protein
MPPAGGEPDLVQAKPARSGGGGSGVADRVEKSSVGQCAMALYDYQAADDTEISFDPDQVRIAFS